MTDVDGHEPLPLAAELTASPSPGAEAAQLFQGLPLGNFSPRRVPRPLVGVSLWCFGALFWAYLVVGEIVVWTAAPEVLGVLAVMGAFGVAWYRGTSQMPNSPRWRWLVPGIIGFCLWLLTLAVSSAVFDTNGRSKAEMAALLLWALAAIAYALGRHLTALVGVPLTPTARASRIAFWLIAGLATLLAGVNIISYA